MNAAMPPQCSCSGRGTLRGAAIWAWAGAIALVLLARPLAAQQGPSSAFLQQQQAIEQEVRDEFNRDLPAEQKVDFDYGGWYSMHFFLWDDGIESSRTYRRNDLRLWSSLSLDQGAHQFYARGKLQYHDFNSGDSYDGNDNDWLGPDLDRGFYQFDLRQAARAYRKERLDYTVRAKVGRDFTEFGTGLALSQSLDQLLLTFENEKWQVQGLGAMSIHSSDDIDTTRPDAGRSERVFWGTQIKYLGLDKHEPFVYFLSNDDQHGESPCDVLRDYKYDSYYLGLGSTGELLRDLRYSTEWVLEGGHSYDDRRSIFDSHRRANIEAWAWDAMVEYLPRWQYRPRFTGEYLFASGDGNRHGSPTDVRGGQRRGGDDSSFSGFGYRDTGLSFGPRLSNVHIWRTGAAFSPFEKIKGLKRMEVGTDWFLYAKHHRDGAVSDPTADEHSGYLGWEMDYFVDWRITSDVAWTARLGTFFPGESFSDETTRTFFLTGVTWSF